MYRRVGRYPTRTKNDDRDDEDEEEEEEEPMVTYELEPLPRSFYGDMPSQDASVAAAASPPSSAQQPQQQQQQAGSASVLRSRGKRSRKESEGSIPVAAAAAAPDSAHMNNNQQQQKHQQQQPAAAEAQQLVLPAPLSLNPQSLTHLQLPKRARMAGAGGAAAVTRTSAENDEKKTKDELDQLMSLAMSVVAAANSNVSSRATAVRGEVHANMTTTLSASAAAAEVAPTKPAMSTGAAHQLPHPVHRSTIPSPPRHSRLGVRDLSIVNSPPQQRAGGGGGKGPTKTEAAAASSILRQSKSAVVAAPAAPTTKKITAQQAAQQAQSSTSAPPPPPPPPPLPSTDRTRAWDIGDEFNQVLLPKSRSDLSFISKQTSTTRGGGGGSGGANKKATTAWGFPIVHPNPLSSRISAAPPPSHSMPVEALAQKAARSQVAASSSSSATSAVQHSSQGSSMPLSLLGGPRGPGENDRLIGVSQLQAIARPSQANRPVRAAGTTTGGRGGTSGTSFQATSVPMKPSQQPPTPRATSVSPDLTKRQPTDLPVSSSSSSSSRNESYIANESSTMKNLTRYDSSKKGLPSANNAAEEKDTEALVDDAVEEDDEEPPPQHPLTLRSGGGGGGKSGSRITMGVIDQANRSIAINTLASMLEPPSVRAAAAAAAAAALALPQNPMQDTIATTTASDIPSFLRDLLLDPSESNATVGGDHLPPSVVDSRSSAQFSHLPPPPNTLPTPTPLVKVLPLTEGHQWVSPSRPLEASAVPSSSSVAAARAKQKKIAASTFQSSTTVLQPSLVAQLMDLRRKVDSEVAMFSHSLGPSSASSTSILRNRGSVEVSLVSIDPLAKSNSSELIVIQAKVISVTNGSDLLLQNKTFDVEGGGGGGGCRNSLLPGTLVYVAFSSAKASSLGIVHRKDAAPKSKRVIIYAPFDILRITSPLSFSSSLSSSLSLLESLTSTTSSSSSSSTNTDRLLPTLLISSTHFCELGATII